MIIGLSGYAGAGKSTAASGIALYGHARMKFAKPLKDMMRALLRCQGADVETVERMIEGDLKEVPTHFLNGATPRHAMQTLGTDWGRALIGESLWVDAAMRNCPADAVFDDCRFQNEFDAIRERGGIVIEIQRAGVGPINGHISEQPPDPDIIALNDGDEDDLRQQIGRLIP